MRKSATVLLCLLALLLILAPHAPASAATQPITLRFRYWGDAKEIAAIATTISEFEASHPGVIVHGERQPPGDEYSQKLLLERASGLLPDVMFVSDQASVLSQHGILANLRPKLAVDHSINIKDYYPEEVRAFDFGSGLYAIPRDVAPEGLVYYNKALFDRMHLPYPDGSWSWDFTPRPQLGNRDFLTVAKHFVNLKDAAGAPIYAYAAGDPTFTLNDCVFSTGASFVDNIYHPTKINYDDPRVLKSLQLVQDMSYKYHVSPTAADLQSTGVGSISGHDLFAQGRAAMYVSGIWETPRFRTQIGDSFKWDIAAFPAGPTGIHAVATGGSGYGMSSTTKHPAEAWELVKFLTGPVGLSNLARTGIAEPALMKLADSPVWLDKREPQNRKLTIVEVPWSHQAVLSPLWSQINTEIINPKLQLVWSDDLTARQAVEAFNGPAQTLLDQLNHPPYHPKLNWVWSVLAMVLVTLGIVGWVWQGARKDMRGAARLGSTQEMKAGYGFISPWILGTAVFLLAPMLVSLVLSFTSWNMIEPARWVGLGNFVAMAADPLFWKSLSVTLIYTVFSVPLGVAGSLLLALLLNTKIRGQSFFRTFYYLPAVASAVAASLIWLKVFDPEQGAVNTVISFLHLNGVAIALHLTEPGTNFIDWLGSEKTALGSLIAMSLWGIGGGMVIFLAGLQGIPQSYYEAADIDGANVWQKFVNVTIPLLTPTIFFSLIIGVIGSFQIFTQAFVMTQGGPNNASLFYVLYLYQNAFQYLKIGYSSALAWILFLIILMVTLVQMRASKWVHYEGADAR